MCVCVCVCVCVYVSIGVVVSNIRIFCICSNNGLYSASHSFTILIFLLTPHNTWGCYYVESNFSYPIFHWNNVFKKCCQKLGVWNKEIRKGVSIENQGQIFNFLWFNFNYFILNTDGVNSFFAYWVVWYIISNFHIAHWIMFYYLLVRLFQLS